MSTPGAPNIVLILADNLGWGELGCYGGGALRGAPTPRIDRLATEGLRLTNFNVESDCVPTRSAPTGTPARARRGSIAWRVEECASTRPTPTTWSRCPRT